MKRQHLASFYFSLWVDYERLGVTRAIEQGIVEKDVCKESTFFFFFFNVFDRCRAEGFFYKKWFFISRINLKHKCPLSKKTCFEYRIFFICTRSYWEPANNIRSQIYSLLQHIAFNMCNNFFKQCVFSNFSFWIEFACVSSFRCFSYSSWQLEIWSTLLIR